eukprot:c16947_g1_i1 orf=995-3871(-)
MAWLGKVTLGNFGDIAGAVTKISESVKNLEKNFDSALGFDGKSQDEAQSSSVERVSLLDPVFAFVGQKDASKEISTPDVWDPTTSPAKHDTSKEINTPDVRDPTTSPAKHDTLGSNSASSDQNSTADSAQGPKDLSEGGSSSLSEVLPKCDPKELSEEGSSSLSEAVPKSDPNTSSADEEKMEQTQVSENEKLSSVQQIESSVEEPASEEVMETGDGEENTTAIIDENQSKEKEEPFPENHQEGETSVISMDSNRGVSDSTPGTDTVITDVSLREDIIESTLAVQKDEETIETDLSTKTGLSSISQISQPGIKDSSNYANNLKAQVKCQPGIEDSSDYVNNLKAQVKSLEEALAGAAHQSKVKADELSRISIENDNLRFTLGDIKRSSDVELENLKEEFQQRLNAAERKVYALTKERDMLRREQGRRDSSILLKEKDEIIKQVMAEGEELSKKQAAQEAQMRKLRAQIRELEEEKQRLKSKLQVEEATVESLRKDKAATEKALQEAVERTQVELAAQREFYTKALDEAKEAEARAEVRADAEAKLELEHLLREAADKETALAQNVEELRQALSREAEQAVSREDMLRRDVEELERRCQAAELRYEELVASVPESTRPLLRQIEAMRDTMAVRAEAWSGVERSLNARLQEAEAKAAASQERERAINERLMQTLSRMAVLEAQVSCLKAEQGQLTRSLEKERQRASENRQEYLAALEAAATHEGRAKQLEEDLKELRSRFKRELAEERTLRELLQKEVEREKQKAVKQEGTLENGNWPITSKANVSHAHTPPESSPGRSLRRFSSGSNGSLEESFFLQASLDPTVDQMVGSRRNSNAGLPKGAPIEQLEAFLSQKEGEIALYTSRLTSLESTRNALAEELVKATTECEKFRTEAASLAGLRSELDSLRRRHASALELMGERDEQVEELKADLADVKQMYREQIDMLVNQIEQLSASISSQ